MKKKKKIRKEAIILTLIIIFIITLSLIGNKKSNANNNINTNINDNQDNKITENISDYTNDNKNNSPDSNTDDNPNNGIDNNPNDNTSNNSDDEANVNINNNTSNSNRKPVAAYPKLSISDGLKENIGTTSKGYEIVTINGVTYVDGYLIANKTYNLPSDYVPENTVESAIGKTNTCNKCINTDVYNAFKDMQSDATALGLNLYISSGYRPYVTQQKIYNNYVARDGVAKADTYSSRAGHSEHQSGLCFDINIINDSFANTEEGKWVNSNAYLYGFIIRYPKGKESETGYKYESWHLRYVGTELAYKLYNNGNWLSLEDYFGITSVYKSE